jgi:hypothetical protein
MHIELMFFGAALGALAFVAKLTARQQRAWLERDLNVGDLRVLSDVGVPQHSTPPFRSGSKAVPARIPGGDRPGAALLPPDFEGLDRHCSPTYFCAKAEFVGPR